MQKLVQGFSVKTCAWFWCENLCRVLVGKPVQGFSDKNCERFCCKNLCRVLVQKPVQDFVAETFFVWFWCKKKQ